MIGISFFVLERNTKRDPADCADVLRIHAAEAIERE